MNFSRKDPKRPKTTTPSRGVSKDGRPCSVVNALLGQTGTSQCQLELPRWDQVELARKKMNLPLSAYELFKQEKQEEIEFLVWHASTAKHVDVDSLIADWWKNSTPSQRAFYNKRVERELQRCRQDILYPSETPISDHTETEAPKKHDMVTNGSDDTKNDKSIDASNDKAPYCLKEAIANLASQLDDESIDFLIKTFLWLNCHFCSYPLLTP